ncbi:hypothetical protein V6N13_042613 [Hibiscus sabdariffa]|uniref:NAD-dependent epimerase/dehydratase domain-containing protein n=1 Tax=Hibiscus sabdariffa TaxID=183260 RepID=A0ABR2G565_9ROSI
MNKAEKVVCVTGATGFIASWLVNLLLQRGYTVNATVRDPNDRKKTEHLLSLEGASERLHLFKAELLEEGCFDSVVEGCVGVFHTASPCYFAVKDPQVEMIEPAVKGTLNVLRSCAKVPSIRRVIITSSLAAVVLAGKPLADDVVVDETWFSDPVICEKFKQWYMLSKTLAEKAAREFSEKNGVDMVTIHPPINGVRASFTANWAETFSNSALRWVDVRDVANAHILAFERPSACGRYCVAGKSVHTTELLKILRELYPDLSLPERCSDEKQSMPAFPAFPTFQVSQERVKSLGINFIPLEVSIKDTVDSLKEKLSSV